MRNFYEEVFELQKLLLHLISPHQKILQNHKQLLLVPNALLCVFKTTHWSGSNRKKKLHIVEQFEITTKPICYAP